MVFARACHRLRCFPECSWTEYTVIRVNWLWDASANCTEPETYGTRPRTRHLKGLRRTAITYNSKPPYGSRVRVHYQRAHRVHYQRAHRDPQPTIVVAQYACRVHHSWNGAYSLKIIWIITNRNLYTIECEIAIPQIAICEIVYRFHNIMRRIIT